MSVLDSSSSLVLFGELFLRIFDPQVRVGRKTFAMELLVWSCVAAAGYLALEPVADASFISDEMLMIIAKVVSVLSSLMVIALAAMLARRAHDCGFSGAWGVLAFVPVLNAVVICLALVWPSQAQRNRWAFVKKRHSAVRVASVNSIVSFKK